VSSGLIGNSLRLLGGSAFSKLAIASSGPALVVSFPLTVRPEIYRLNIATKSHENVRRYP
jgi:hypothetical protein